MSTFDDQIADFIHSLEANIVMLEKNREALLAEIVACETAYKEYRDERDIYLSTLEQIAQFWWGPSRKISRAALEQGKKIRVET